MFWLTSDEMMPTGIVSCRSSGLSTTDGVGVASVLSAVSGCGSGVLTGASLGAELPVTSTGSQPRPSIYTSTHACSSLRRTST